MSLKIKLARMGRKKRPSYRVVVAEERSKVTGKAVDTLGFYNPQVSPPEIKVDRDLIKKWMANGVRPTAAVRKILEL